MTFDECVRLLSAGLNLCVRARKLDGAPCGTINLWVQDQYDKDLAEWEESARSALIAIAE